MSNEWPADWERVYCKCGVVIGGYNRRTAPTVLHIEHGCGYKTTIYPFNVADFPMGASVLNPRRRRHG